MISETQSRIDKRFIEMRQSLCIMAITLCTTMGANAQTNSDRIAAFVNDLPRTELGGAMYWLEMKTIVGWEKMMLVVGYATNEPICDRLAMVVRLDAPDRKFRCSTAN